MKAEPIMIKTDRGSNLPVLNYFSDGTKVLDFWDTEVEAEEPREGFSYYDANCIVPQHFYLIDLEAEIKEGDHAWCTETNEIIQVSEVIQEQHKYRDTNGKTHYDNFDPWKWYKIICSTDKSLDVPQLSAQSIKLLIDYYNKNGKMPDEVAVVKPKDESICRCGIPKSEHLYEKEGVVYNKYRHPFVPVNTTTNSQGTVEITISEDRVYSRKEMEALCHKLISDYQEATHRRTSWSWDTDDWISQHMKF